MIVTCARGKKSLILIISGVNPRLVFTSLNHCEHCAPPSSPPTRGFSPSTLHHALITAVDAQVSPLCTLHYYNYCVRKIEYHASKSNVGIENAFHYVRERYSHPFLESVIRHAINSSSSSTISLLGPGIWSPRSSSCPVAVNNNDYLRNTRQFPGTASGASPLAADTPSPPRPSNYKGVSPPHLSVPSQWALLGQPRLLCSIIHSATSVHRPRSADSRPRDGSIRLYVSGR